MEDFADLHLRKAVKDDIDLLFRWVNDPQVRRNAFQTADIPYERHAAWFHGILQDVAVRQYLLCQGGKPVGQIRLNLEGNAALIDYSIAPDLRGRGYGCHMLELVKEKALEDAKGVTCLVGQVKYENTASARVFEKCGYCKTEKEGYIEFRFIIKK